MLQMLSEDSKINSKNQFWHWWSSYISICIVLCNRRKFAVRSLLKRRFIIWLTGTFQSFEQNHAINMVWIRMILVAFCLSPGIHANFPNETEARSGHQRAKDYIWKQRDEKTGFWPREEVIPAVLGKSVKILRKKFSVYVNLLVINIC